MLKTVLGSPESKLEARVPMSEVVSSKYTIGAADIQPIEINNRLLRKDITKRLGLLAEDLSDEVSFALEAVWGTSQEWKTVSLMGSLEEIIARSVNRIVFPGLLCRCHLCSASCSLTFKSNSPRSQRGLHEATTKIHDGCPVGWSFD